MLEMRPDHPEEVLAQRALWKAAFGDEDHYIDQFCECHGASADVLKVVEEGRLVSVLALLPQMLILPGGGTAPGWYIYALAADSGACSKDYDRQLLRFVGGYLTKRGADCVTTVPAEPSLFEFFGTVGLAPCSSTRKLELLKNVLQPAVGGDRAEPVKSGEYNATRRRLLKGAPAVDYPEGLIRYQQGMGRLPGGGLYRLSVDGGEGCAVAEYTDGESVLFKELLLSPGKMGRRLMALERILPGMRCYVRTPVLWDGMKSSYLQPFGMIKWYSAEKRAFWGKSTHGHIGLGLDRTGPMTGADISPCPPFCNLYRKAIQAVGIACPTEIA